MEVLGDKFKTLLLILLAGLFLFVGGRALLAKFASDETKIRRRIDSMVEAFNDTRTNQFMAGLGERYEDEDSGFQRDEIRDALRYAFFTEVDAAKSFRLEATLVPEELLIQFAEPERKQATVSLHTTIRYTDAEPDAALWWDAEVEGIMELVDGSWKWRRTTEVNHSARKLR